MAFTPGRGPARLEPGVTREEVASDARAAALELMAGAAGGWDKLDLVLWLTGAYHRATRHVPRGERVTSVDDSDEVETDAIEELVVRVRQQMLASLESAAISEGVLDFAEEAITRGLVRKSLTEEEDEVWVPVDGSRMRLRDRVRALFAADYLNAPEAYIELFVCHRCEAIVFDAGAKRLGLCGAHKRLSGVVPREGGSAPDTAKAAGSED
jgi:hypothetical protein